MTGLWKRTTAYDELLQNYPWYQSKLIYDFLVINTNLPPILHRFQVMVDYYLLYFCN